MNRARKYLLAVILAATFAAAGARRALADANTDLTSTAQTTSAYAGLNEQLDSQVPLNLDFVDSTGATVQLSKYFNTGRPIVLQLGYFQCPMLCSQISRGLLDAAKKMDLKAGKDFDFLFVSINPSEDWRLAGLKRQSYLADYGSPDTAGGFHFLVGQPYSISEVCSAVGYHYSKGIIPGEYNTPDIEAYAHPAVLVILTPEGHVSRYLYGISFDPRTLQLSLDEASHGKIGTLTDHIELLVCNYDAHLGGYALVAMKVMRLGGVITVLALGGTIFWLSRKHPTRK